MSAQHRDESPFVPFGRVKLPLVRGKAYPLRQGDLPSAGPLRLTIELMNERRLQAVLAFGWALLAVAAFVPTHRIPVSVQIQAGAFGALVVALVAATAVATTHLRWGRSMGATLRVCWVLVAVASGSFRGRMDFTEFASVFVASLVGGAAVGAVVRARTARRKRHAEL